MASKSESAASATKTEGAETATGTTAPAAAAVKDVKDMSPDEYQAYLESQGHGMTDLSRPEIDGYFNAELSKETRGVVKGRIIGFTAFNTPNGMREMVIVKLGSSKDAAYAGLMAVKKGKEKVQLKPGQNIGIGITSELKELPYYVEHRGGLMLTALEKKQIGGGKTVWKHFVKVSGTRGNKPNVEAEATENVGMDDIPF